MNESRYGEISLMIKINNEKCIKCQACLEDCFTGALAMVNEKIEFNQALCIACNHCIAVCPTDAVRDDSLDMNESLELAELDNSIEAIKLLNFIKSRRTIRKYKDIPLTEDEITTIIEAGRHTQTASNAQDVEYTVIVDKMTEFRKLTYDALEDKANFYLDKTNKAPKLMRRYALMWKSMIKAFRKDPKQDKLFFNAPCVILVSANNPINGHLASANMSLMIESLELGSLFSGFFTRAAEDNQPLQDFLNIYENKTITNCIVVGHPDVTYKRTAPRKKAIINWL
jgi:ferredoxin/nitroreductase